MDKQDNTRDELRSLNSDLPVGNSPFSVPEGYFDGLANQILTKVKSDSHSAAAAELATLSPMLAGIAKQLPYTVPEGYFDANLAGLSFLQPDEVLPPVLTTVGKTLPYTVPDNYFGQLPQQVITRLVRPKAKVVPFFSRTWTKAAVAALIGGLVVLGGYRLLNKDDATAPLTAKQGAETAPAAVATNGSRVTQSIQNASTEELEAFINTVPLNPAKLQRASLEQTDQNEIANWLKGVSKTEIDAFLEGLPTADDNLMIID